MIEAPQLTEAAASGMASIIELLITLTYDPLSIKFASIPIAATVAPTTSELLLMTIHRRWR